MDFENLITITAAITVKTHTLSLHQEKKIIIVNNHLTPTKVAMGPQINHINRKILFVEFLSELDKKH